MKILVSTLILISMAIALNGQVFTAGSDFVADSASYSPGFTLTDGATTVTAVGTDAPGNAISLWFDTTVDMSGFLTGGTILDFTANGGHTATSSFSISLFDSTFGGEDIITGFNWADTSLVSSTLSSATVDLTDIQNIVINTGGIGDSVNVDIYSLGIPEPSTYALILGAIVLGFVAYRRK